jgi:YD repeat-containing protein
MKSLLLIVILILSTLSAFCQTNNVHSHSDKENFPKTIPSTLVAHSTSLSYTEESRSANEECLLDSIVEYFDGELGFRHTYQYDSEGNLIESMHQTRFETQWRNNTRHSYSYNQQGAETEELRSGWENNNWKNELRFSSTYDLQNNRTEYIMEVWNGSNYVNSDRKSYSYDSDGRLTETTMQDWVNGAWKNHIQFTYAYALNDSISEKIELGWDNGEFVNYIKYSYEYDLNNRTISSLSQFWTNSEWVDWQRITYQFNGENLDRFWIEQNNTGSWQDYYRVIYSYDQNDIVAEELRQYSNGAGYQDRHRFSFVNNTEGFHTYEFVEENTSGLVNDWVNTEQFEYEYDASGNMVRSSRSEWQMNEWSPWNDDHYFFDCATNGIEENVYPILAFIYPNPATDHLFVQFSDATNSFRSIKFFDAAGTLILENSMLGHDNRLDLNVSAGFYIVSIETTLGNSVQKLLVW